MKIYIASRQISIGITMGDKQKSIDFVAMSGNGSTFKTNNRAEQKAIEAHPQFGKMFKIYLSDEEEETGGAKCGSESEEGVKSEEGRVKNEAAEGASAPAEKSEEGVKSEEAEGAKDGAVDAEKEEKVFDCFEDAREWASETLGVPKKKLMSKTAVIRYGSEAGYVITIKD